MRYYKKSGYLKIMFVRYILLGLLVLVLVPVLASIFKPEASASSIHNLIYIVATFGLLQIALELAGRAGVISDKYVSGMGGEYLAKDELSELDDQFTVIQNLPMHGIGDIDFVVVGPTGVFALEVKAHKWPNEYQAAKFLIQAKREAYNLAKYLESKLGEKIWVDSIVVLAKCKRQLNFGRRENGYLVPTKYVRNIIQTGKPFPMEKAQKIVDLLNAK